MLLPLPPTAGPFTPVYRMALLAEWVDHLKQSGVTHSEGTSLIMTLQEPVKVRVCACVHACVCACACACAGCCQHAIKCRRVWLGLSNAGGVQNSGWA